MYIYRYILGLFYTDRLSNEARKERSKMMPHYNPYLGSFDRYDIFHTENCWRINDVSDSSLAVPFQQALLGLRDG
jgi:hypothetical protein